MQDAPRPLLIYDGDCDFCAIWVEHWRRLTGETVNYQPFQAVEHRYPSIPHEVFERGVQFITAEGKRYSNAAAVFYLLRAVPRRGWLWLCYRFLPGFALAAELIYRFIATHRDFAYRATRFLWGDDVGPHLFILTRWLFLRLLGLVYLVAFGSLAFQILGLVGSSGILPAADYLTRVEASLPGAERFALVPTLAWLDAGDTFLQLLCVGGVVLSLLLLVNVFPAPMAFLCWLFYLSLYSIGQTFLSFQWDALLLETGFLAIFLGPLPLLRFRLVNPSLLVVWLYRWLLFRLMFGSGMVKLLSGDPVWRDLTALDYHYWTQPLPTPLAWYAHQLPPLVQRASCLVMFIIELGVPFLYFLPRRPRLVAALLTILLQVMILLTGNYTFFNWLTIALCVWLLDDGTLRRFFPRAMVVHHVRRPQAAPLRRLPLVALTLLLLCLSSLSFASRLAGENLASQLPAPLAEGVRYASALRLSSSYGLFASMTTSRPEIIIEGSLDGETWREYRFPFKADAITDAPRWVAPYHPRLDWQMWFAALGTYQNQRWFGSFALRLLQGSPDVLALLEANPFPNAPPRFIRAWVVEYRFSDGEARQQIGAWWARGERREYMPPVSGSQFGR